MNPLQPSRRLLGGLALAAAVATPLGAFAQAYPAKPITIVVPFAAGGTTDILARVIGQALSEDLGHPVVIDNRAGAGGNIAGQFASRYAADGYTLFMGTVGTNAINEWLYAKMPFKPNQDLAPLTRYDQVGPALGGGGEMVTDPTQIGPALARADASGVPYLVNVITDVNAAYPRSTFGV